MERDKKRTEAIEKIAKTKKMSLADASEHFKELVNQKVNELGGLITNEGAESIVIAELGIRWEKPSTTPRSSTIHELSPDMFGINIVVIVASVGQVTEFTNKQGQLQKRCSITLSDDTGTVPMTLWREYAVAVQSGSIQGGTVLKIEGGYTKEAYNPNYDVELCLSRRGRIIIDPEGVNTDHLPKQESREVKIAELVECIDRPFIHTTVTARITKLFTKVAKVAKNGVKYIQGFMRDKTGSASFIMWGDTTDLVENGTIDESKVIRFEKVRVRSPWGNNTIADVSIDDETTTSEVSDATEEDFPTEIEFQAVQKPLVDAKDGDRIEFIGVVTSVRCDFFTKSFWRTTCPHKDCSKGVKPQEENIYLCPKHGEVRDYTVEGLLRGRVSDGTKEFDFACYGKVAEKLIGTEVSSIIETSKAVGSDNYVNQIGKKLIGKYYQFLGNVWATNNTGNLSITINSFEDTDFPKETADVIREMTEFLKIQGK